MKKMIVLAVALGFAAALGANAADGKAVYAKDCTKCHGEDGKGQTKMGQKVGCKDYSVEAFKMDEAFKVVKEGLKDKDGKTQMKAFGETLSDDEIKAALTYMATLKK